MTDIIVVGAGPAGLTAALYARRADKTVLVLEKESFGGQIINSPKVENYPGFAQMSGSEFAEKLLDQVLAQGAEIEMAQVTGIAPGKTPEEGFTVQTEEKAYQARSVILATGSRHRPLGVPGEERFLGAGLHYCALCDGAFYAGMPVAVIGGGNSALQEAVLLADRCSRVTLVQNLDFFTGEERLLEILRQRDNVEMVTGTVVDAVLGGDRLTGLRLRTTDGELSELAVDGVFVAIGQIPQNEPFREWLPLDAQGYIPAGEDCNTALPGLFVAGDCRSKGVRQITTAAADGSVAAIAACRYLDR